MKRKLLLTAIIAFAFLFILTICISAAQTGSTSDEFGEVTEVSGMTSAMLDRDARVVLKNADGTFTTYYTYYIYPKKAWNNSMVSPDFKQLNDATGENYTASSMIRVELLSDCTAFSLPKDATTVSLKEIVYPDDLAITTLPRIYPSDFPVLEKVYIGSGFTEIAGNTFRELPSLKYVSFSENFSLTTLGAGMFIGCVSLEEIELPNSVTTISSGLFAGCTSLKSVRFSANATSIGGNVFVTDNVVMPSLKMVYMPSGITSINRSNLTYGNQPTTAITIFFTGTKEQAQAIISSTNVTLLKNATLEEWDKTKDDSYYMPPTDTANWRVVYNYNECIAFYGGIHIPDPEKTSACADVCKNCELVTLKENPNHNLKVSMDFKDFVSSITKTTACQNVGCPYNENPQIEALAPVFEILGFSTNYDKTKLVMGYKLNAESYLESGKSISYGVVAYISSEEACSPLEIVNGAIAPKDPDYTIFADLSAIQTSFDFIIVGINGVSTSLVMCAYIYDGSELSYLNCENGALVQSSTAKTYELADGKLIL